MLRNMQIRTRLAVMAAGPAVIAVILTAVMFALIPSVMVTGSAYEQISVGKDFQTTTASPSLYIVEIDNDVQRLLSLRGKGPENTMLRADITQRRASYQTSYQKWSTELNDSQAKTSLRNSHDSAERYFALYQDTFLPALDTGKLTVASQVLATDMTNALNSHRDYAQAAARRVSAQVAEQETAAAAKVRRQALGFLGITLLVVAASTAVGITVLRSINDRVRRLNETATIELPRMLDEVKRATQAGEEIPALPTRTLEGRDELTAAANAFNAVIATAVDLAVDQSRLRRATSQMFINLGRRNHKLLSRTLTYITQLEGDERDPETLQNLFRLDHLTTRMRRHAESLLVLAGSPPLRTWSRPVPVADVLRAALSEIETYDRVDIKELEQIEIRGASVSDLAHLLAELLENATAFSPPQTRVRVLGRTDNDGYTIVVVDEGIGMSPQELSTANDLIGTSDDSGLLGDSRMLGLGVVGRLAARHGFRVSLTASPVGGVVAWVTLPTSTLAPRRGGEPQPPAPLGTTDLADFTAAATGFPSGAPASGPAAPRPGQTTASALPTRPTGDQAPAIPHRPVPPKPADQPFPAPVDPSSGRIPMAPTAPAQPQAPARPATPAPAPTPAARPIPAAQPAAPAPAPAAGPAAPAPVPAAEVVPGTGLRRRVRGAQLPDTGDISTAPAAQDRPDRTAASVRGALASFTAGRLTASNSTSERDATGPLETVRPATAPGDTAGSGSSGPSRPATVTLPDDEPSGQVLPRRVRGAQMPETDLPEANAPAPERSAAEVRAALSNFVAGRRAAEHED